MRNAKKWVITFLAVIPILWLFLTMTTGLMSARVDISEYSFGSVVVSNGSISYTAGSPAEAVLSVFIPSGTAVSDLTGGLKACYNLAVVLSSGSSAFLLGVGGAPNSAILVSLLYFLYLVVLELLNLAVSLIVLPVRLASKFFEGVS